MDLFLRVESGPGRKMAALFPHQIAQGGGQRTVELLDRRVLRLDQHILAQRRDKPPAQFGLFHK